MENIILLGTGGHARSVVDSIEAGGKYRIAGLLDKEIKAGDSYRDYRVLGTDDLLEDIFKSGIRNAFVSIGYLGIGDVRNRLYERLKSTGFILPDVVDPTSVIAGDVELGEGVFVGKNAVINANAKIENMCIINTAAVIEHDCNIGQFSHVAVGAVVCGGARIGKASLIGANATVIQERIIGNNCIVGAGAVVRRNLADGQIFTGDKR